MAERIDEGTGGELLAAQLVAEGVDVVFGVPGAQLDWAVDGLSRRAPGVRFVHTRHEQGAAYMADGYARSTGRPGVFFVVPGPGMLNAAAALSTAWACSSPVVAVVAAVPRGAEERGQGILHEIRGQSDILRLLSKWHVKAESAAELPALLSEAITRARSDRPRPVVLEVPADVFRESGSAFLVEPVPPTRIAPDPAAVAAAVDALGAAERPVLVAGSGVVASDAQPELVELAELLGAPVMATTNGRSAIDGDHPLAMTNAVGRHLVADADLVLGVGTRLVNAGGAVLRTSPDAVVVQLNADESDLAGERPTAVGIHADARLGLTALTTELRRRGAPPRTPPLDRIAALRARYRAAVAELGEGAVIVETLRAALPADSLVVTDLTQVGYLANAVFPVHSPRSFLTSGWQGTLGYAFPTALGVKTAHPDRPVVALVGDGGFGFSLNELATAVGHGINLVTVCFVDGAYGNVRRTQATTFGGRYLATELTNPDFVALAEAFGARGFTVRDPDGLEQTIRDAIKCERPAVVVVPVGPMPSPWPLLTDVPMLGEDT